MENIFGIATIPSVMIICYLAAQIIKTTKIENKHIPSICGGLGGMLGAAGMFVIPNYPAADIYTAVAIGIVSGLAATGVNQIFKQYKSSGE